ncbi:MAG: response regulator transcription factor [Eubacterium sp.]|nr:response regulator transcription factor [Eubacterium sp.]
MDKILLIEDNDEINHMLATALSKAGYCVKSAFSGTEGLLYFSMEEYALVLLDLMLPGLSGEEVLTKLREGSKTPVIVISAKTEIVGKVDLLEHGADDYITKPFDIREVLARVKLQINKGKKEISPNRVIGWNGLEIDDSSHTITIDGNLINFTRQEYNILFLLFSNPEKVFTKQELFESAWNEIYMGEDKTLNVHISNIRNKIKQFTNQPYIDTIWGIGFRAGGK